VAHNVATSHVIRQQRTYARLVSLEEVDSVSIHQEDEIGLDRSMARERLLLLIQRLKPIDRQVILSYLEGMDAASIGEITGMSPANVGMKIHRVKSILTRRLRKGGQHAG
jgi:RNA polymerase sigma-70 factor (ECF subfamily)